MSVFRRRPFSLRRRDFLAGSAALGAFALTGCGRPANGALAGLIDDVAPQSFPMGAACGDVTDRAAVLWTRFIGQGPLEVELSLDDGTGAAAEPVLSREVTDVGDGGFVHLNVDGLIPGAQYRYVFREKGQDAQKVEGTFRAAIAPNALERLTFSASVCTRNGRSMSTLSALAAQHAADVHLLLGDTTYADGSVSLDDYRGKWAENLTTQGYRALRQSRSVLATWDDHEIANDWSGASMDPEKVKNGEAAFFEHTPMRRFPDQPARIWHSVRWGLTVEFFIMDGRSERRQETRDTPQAEYISKAQLAWLKDALKSSPAHFKVLVNSVPIGAFPGPFAAWTKDCWMGYQAQRDDLLSFIESEVQGAFFVSGDYHMASLNAVSLQGPGSRLVEILAGASACSSPNPFIDLCRPPMFSFASTLENTTLFDLDPEQNTVAVRWVGGDGRTIAERAFRPA